MKNREFGKEAAQNFCWERATLAERQGASEDKNFAAKVTTQKQIFQVISVYTVD